MRHRRNSYIAVRKDTGKAAFEFFDERMKRHINPEKYEVMTAGEYLAKLNESIRATSK